MTRTVSGLWSQVIDFENLHAAYLEARKGKRFRAEVLRYSLNAEEHLANLQNHLIWKSWKPGRQREFVVREPKLRAIQAPPFADRVLHHALVRVIDPIFESRFIADSFACRTGKGTQACVKRTQHFVRLARQRWGDGVYVIKADISKYFASIRHDVLLTEVQRVISDHDALWLLQRGIDFAGYRVWPTHILPRKRNIKRARSNFKQLAKLYASGKVTADYVRQRVNAFTAYTKHCNAQVTEKAVLRELDARADNFLL